MWRHEEGSAGQGSGARTSNMAHARLPLSSILMRLSAASSSSRTAPIESRPNLSQKGKKNC